MKMLNLRKYAALVASVFCFHIWVTPALADVAEGKQESRLALVIGNANYGAQGGQLANPINDAKGITAKLKAAGFEVLDHYDVNRKQMRNAIREFGERLRDADVGLIYFSGHATQVNGENYLIPIGYDISREHEVEDEAVRLSFLLGNLTDAHSKVNIVILDACRNNPFSKAIRAPQRGLAVTNAPSGTLIAYATQPGNVASDGNGTNSPYTEALLKHMNTPGVSLLEIFQKVRAEVMQQTGKKQEPWEHTSLINNFYFIQGNQTNITNNAPFAPAPPASAVPPAPIVNTLDPKTVELSFWDSIKNSNNPEDFKAYLQKYPSGEFVALAKQRTEPIKTLQKQQDEPPISSEETTWSMIESSGNPADYRDYLVRYPTGKYISDATNRWKVITAYSVMEKMKRFLLGNGNQWTPVSSIVFKGTYTQPGLNSPIRFMHAQEGESRYRTSLSLNGQNDYQVGSDRAGRWSWFARNTLAAQQNEARIKMAIAVTERSKTLLSFFNGLYGLIQMLKYPAGSALTEQDKKAIARDAKALEVDNSARVGEIVLKFATGHILLDVATGQPSAVVNLRVGQGQVRFENYRVVGGFKLPHKFEFSNQQIFEFSEIELNPHTAESWFDRQR